jgi:hypothetical protein
LTSVARQALSQAVTHGRRRCCGPRISASRATGAALVLALLPAAVRAGDVELFPAVTAQLEGAYYVPPEDAFVWDTWVGGGAGLLRVKAATAYISADVETILGRERRTFDANQVNYHLEAGLRVRAGRHLVIPFFHHVSRHVVDRPKTQLVDWNMVGVRVTGPLPPASPLAGRYLASVGHTVEWRTVGYQWELTGVLDLEVLRRPWGTPYLRADVRFVTVDAQGSLPRGDFADFLGRGGVRFGRGGRKLDLFVAFEHRNDVLLFVPGVRDRALLGLGIGFTPGDSTGPTLRIGWPGQP